MFASTPLCCTAVLFAVYFTVFTSHCVHTVQKIVWTTHSFILKNRKNHYTLFVYQTVAPQHRQTIPKCQSCDQGRGSSSEGDVFLSLGLGKVHRRTHGAPTLQSRHKHLHSQRARTQTGCTRTGGSQDMFRV